MACQRQKDDLARQGWAYRFDRDRANRVCRFVESLPHIKGQWAGTNIRLEDWQCFLLTTVFGWVDGAGRRRFKTAYSEIPRKNAKLLDVNTPMLTARGWRTMGTLEIGDLVHAPDGSLTEVTAVGDVQAEATYRIRFAAGQEMVAGAGHQWLVSDRNSEKRVSALGKDPQRWHPWVIRTTEQMAPTYLVGNRTTHRERRYAVAIPAPLERPDFVLPVDPYVLGAWLGDGNTAGARITGIDEEIHEAVVGAGYAVGARGATYCSYRGLHRPLRMLGVLGRKHIPQPYLLASESQRLALLQGLMDTDGTVNRGPSKWPRCWFSNSNRQLAEDVLYLARSLGWKATFSERRAILRGKDCGPCYQVGWTAWRDRPPFRLERKIRLLGEAPDRATRSQSNQIVEIEQIPRRPMRCIEVAHPSHCYLAGEGLVPTHNSTLSSGIGLYLLAADGEAGAEVYSAATTYDQAKIVWEDAKRMVQRSPAMREALGVDASAYSVFVLRAASSFKALSRDQRGNLDGLNVHGAIIDELHGHKDRGVWDVMETATGSRTQPLIWAITTAGFNRAGICYEQRSYVCKILEGVAEDPEYFGVIYTCDPEDDPFDPGTWQKANPNWGVSVDPGDIARKARKAMEMASAQNNFLTKHLNVWVNADTAWMNMHAWERCGDPQLEIGEFEGEPCIIACDLANRVDLAAEMRLFWRDEDDGRHYYGFGRYYLPEQAVEDGRNSQYSGWARTGRVTVTPGNTTDFGTIEDDIRDDAARFRVLEAAFDPWQASQISQRLGEEGLATIEHRQIVANMSEAMKELEALVLERRFHFDGDPVLTWCISNVVAHLDAKENIYPRKERPENKIDPVVALIMSLDRALRHMQRSIYEDSDIFVL